MRKNQQRSGFADEARENEQSQSSEPKMPTSRSKDPPADDVRQDRVEFGEAGVVHLGRLRDRSGVERAEPAGGGGKLSKKDKEVFKKTRRTDRTCWGRGPPRANP